MARPIREGGKSKLERSASLCGRVGLISQTTGRRMEAMREAWETGPSPPAGPHVHDGMDQLSSALERVGECLRVLDRRLHGLEEGYLEHGVKLEHACVDLRRQNLEAVAKISEEVRKGAAAHSTEDLRRELEALRQELQPATARVHPSSLPCGDSRSVPRSRSHEPWTPPQVVPAALAKELEAVVATAVREEVRQAMPSASLHTPPQVTVTLPCEEQMLDRVSARVKEAICSHPLRVDHSEVLAAIGTAQQTIVQNAHQARVLEAIGSVHRDVVQIGSKVDHSDVLQAIRNDLHALPKADFCVDHSQVLDAIRRVHRDIGNIDTHIQTIPTTGFNVDMDLSKILDAIRIVRSDIGKIELRGNQSDVLQAISDNLGALSSLDFSTNYSQILEAIRSVHTDIIGKVDSKVDHSDVLTAISGSLQALHQKGVTVDYSKLLDAINMVRRDISRIETKVGHADTLQAIGPEVRALSTIDVGTELSKVLDAIRGVHRDIGNIDTRVERISNTNFNVDADLSKVLDAIGTVHGDIGKIGLKVDHSDVLQGIRNDLHALSNVHVSADHSQVLAAIQRVQSDIGNISTQIETIPKTPFNLDMDLSKVLEAIGTVHRDIGNIGLKVDHSDVLQGIRNDLQALPTVHAGFDFPVLLEAISTVHRDIGDINKHAETLSKAGFNVDVSKVLDAIGIVRKDIGSLGMKVDHSDVLQAISYNLGALSNLDFSANYSHILEAIKSVHKDIGKLDSKVDHSDDLQAINDRLQALPRTDVSLDISKLLDAIGTVQQPIMRIDAHSSQMLEALSSVQHANPVVTSNIDHSELAQAISGVDARIQEASQSLREAQQQSSRDVQQALGEVTPKAVLEALGEVRQDIGRTKADVGADLAALRAALSARRDLEPMFREIDRMDSGTDPTAGERRHVASPGAPLQWTRHVDPGSGQEYYYNQVTQQSQWDRPVGFMDAIPMSPDRRPPPRLRGERSGAPLPT